nr:MazG-like family protein [Sporolactobacillus mangiferae]
MNDVQEWEKQFYEERGWKQLPPYIRVGFLAEEVGEVSRAVRACEIGRDHPGEVAGTSDEVKLNLLEEVGDVISNLAILSDLYGFRLEDAVLAHRSKLEKRYSRQRKQQ